MANPVTGEAVERFRGKLRCRAVELGIAKVNVNTELRERYLAVTAERIEAAHDGLRLLELNRAQTDAIADIAGAKLDLCAGR